MGAKALKISCGFCGAQPGERCRTWEAHRYLKRQHSIRIREAAEQVGDSTPTVQESTP